MRRSGGIPRLFHGPRTMALFTVAEDLKVPSRGSRAAQTKGEDVIHVLFLVLVLYRLHSPLVRRVARLV